MRIRRVAVAAGLFIVGLLCLAPPAAADPTGDAAAALQTTNLYIDAAAQNRGAKLGPVQIPRDVKIAVLPDSGGSAVVAARQIGSSLGAGPGNPLTIAVFMITEDRHGSFRAASSKFCSGYADAQARAVVADHVDELRDNLDLTATVQDFLTRLQRGPVDSGGRSCDGVSSGDAAKSAGSSDSGAVWPWVVGIGAVGAGGIGGLVLYSRRSNKRKLDLARTKIMPYYDQLAGEINTLDPGDDAKARQAMADASERFAAAGSLLSSADTVEKYGVARRTVLEGLYAARTAREALGIDPGPPLPPIEQTGHAQLQEPQEVSVQGQTFNGYPSYTPGAPYYFGGGGGVPGGWYQFPFWETLLLGSVLSGGFGGWGGGGFERGYEAGYDAGHDNNDSAGGDFGGGDFGGGDFGGGDFGGGDFGGGDFGGGGDGGSW